MSLFTDHIDYDESERRHQKLIQPQIDAARENGRQEEKRRCLRILTNLFLQLHSDGTPAKAINKLHNAIYEVEGR